MSLRVTRTGLRFRPNGAWKPADQAQCLKKRKAVEVDDRIRRSNDSRAGVSSRTEGCRLPAGIAGTLTHRLFAPLLTISGVALGNATCLETDLFSRPVNSSLLCALVSDQPRWLEGLVDAPAQPLRDEQDRRVAALGKTGPREIRTQIQAINNDCEAFFGDAIVRDPSAVASFNGKIRELEKLLSPSVIIENPPPGSIERAAARSGGSLLAVYNDSAVQRLLASSRKAGLDLDALSCAFQGRKLCFWRRLWWRRLFDRKSQDCFF